MTDTTTTPEQLLPKAAWGWLLFAGIATSLIGLVLLTFPAAATLAVTLFAGWAFIFAGLFGLVGAIADRADGGLWTGLILGVLEVVLGGFLLFNPLAGTLTLTMVFIIWLLADGVAGTLLSIVRRGAHWGWWLVSSLISLGLGVLLLVGFPTSAIWILGTYGGIVLLFRGLALTFIAFDLRGMRKRLATA